MRSPQTLPEAELPWSALYSPFAHPPPLQSKYSVWTATREMDITHDESQCTVHMHVKRKTLYCIVLYCIDYIIKNNNDNKKK